MERRSSQSRPFPYLQTHSTALVLMGAVFRAQGEAHPFFSLHKRWTARADGFGFTFFSYSTSFTNFPSVTGIPATVRQEQE